VKANIFRKWHVRHELVISDWSLQRFALHEQEELDSGLVLIKD
jgi:hypothetical protein